MRPDDSVSVSVSASSLRCNWGGVTSDVNSGETNQLGSMDDSVLMDRDRGGVSN